jgi:hypothetical protein
MKRGLLAVLILGALVAGAQAAPKYYVGMELGGEDVIRLSYTAAPYDEGSEVLKRLGKGQIGKSELAEINSSQEMAKCAHLENKKDITIGDIPVPAGSYDCGFNADEKGTFYFVVWAGGEAKKTKLEVNKHQEAKIPSLTFLFGPAERGNALMVLYGDTFSLLPVKMGIAEAPKEVKAEGGSDTAKPAAAEEKKTEGGSDTAKPAAAEEKKAEGAKKEEGAKAEEEESWDDVNTHSFSGK